jgi:hypothetical protein
MASGLQAHRSDPPSLPGHWAAGTRHTFLAIRCGQWRSYADTSGNSEKSGVRVPTRRVRLFLDQGFASPVAKEESYFLDTESRGGKTLPEWPLCGITCAALKVRRTQIAELCAGGKAPAHAVSLRNSRNKKITVCRFCSPAFDM